MSDPLVDRDALAGFLRDTLPEFGGEFSVERVGEGQSCLTFMVTGDGWQVVLRRPPRGDLPPSAFDVTREYRVTRALHEHDAPVPVARPLALCEDSTVIGAPFYVMEAVDGVVARTTLPPALSSIDDRRRMSEQLVDTLIALRGVDHIAAGLERFGRPDGYLERQLKRMDQLWQLARFRDLPDLEKVGAWIADRVPAQSGTTIVHGDYKLDNVIFAPASPAKLVAVVDWEMSTIGDPLADLGWMLYFWREKGDIPFSLTVSSVTDQEGFFTRRDLLHRYIVQTGADVKDIEWYAAMAGWKIAIIMEGSYRRFLGGIGDHPMFAQLEHFVPALAARALQAATGDLNLR